MDTVIGGYRLEAELGKGASGTVYRARRASGSDLVAVKVLAASLANDPGFRARFAREATVMEQLSHPNCVAVRDHGGDDLDAWIVMEYVHGASLRSVLKAAGTLTPAQACGVLTGALAGLGHAHAAGLVHRDFKPENILVDETGVSKLADFGLTVDREDATTWHSMEGSPTYMSPEQVRGEPLDSQSDIYAAGAVLYELLTGHPPYQADTPLAILHAQVDAPLPSVDALPPKVGAVTRWALAKDRQERPATAAQFADALKEAADDDLGAGWLAAAGLAGAVAGVQATSLSGNGRPRSNRPRWRLASALVGVAAIAAIAAIALVLWPAVSTSTSKRALPPPAAPAVHSTLPLSPARPVVDPCLVGSWQSTAETSFYQEEGGSRDVTTGGTGIVRMIQPDGSETQDYTNSTPFRGRASNGQPLLIVLRGTTSGNVVAGAGVEVDSSAINVSTLTVTVSIGGQPISNVHVIPSSTQATYSCGTATFTEQRVDGTSDQWAH